MGITDNRAEGWHRSFLYGITTESEGTSPLPEPITMLLLGLGLLGLAGIRKKFKK
jgi:hypothetical protein